MRNRLLSFLTLLGVLFLTGCNLRSIKQYSPDKNICVIVKDSTMTVKYKNRTIQTVKLDLGPRSGWERGRESVQGNYKMISGKRSACIYKFRDLLYGGLDKRNLLVRVFNDGVAFQVHGGDESVSYVIPDGTKRWLQRQKTDYEGFYQESTSATGGKYNYPALIEYGDGLFGLITESGINHGNSCSYLTCDGDEYTVTYTDADSNYFHPWRLIIIGGLADIVESTLVTDVAEPCRIGDTSWIKPGVSSWIYWAYNHS